MIKVGDRVKIVSLYKWDAYFRDGMAGSRGVVQSVDGVKNINGVNYYAGQVLIDNPSDTAVPEYDYDDLFYFAYAQLRKIKK